jgi:hypothetical protein
MTLLKELVQLNEAEENSVETLGKAIAAAVNQGGTRIFDIDMDVDTLHFAIEFDFPEGLIKGAEIKKVSKMISRVGVQKAPDWRHGQHGADYSVELKNELSPEDEKKLVDAFKKAIK